MSAGLLFPAGAAADGPDLARFVNPFNGTQPGQEDFGTGGGAGNTFPGPVLPFGMIQWSPDTQPGTDNPGGGYAYDDKTIRGFGVRHLSGAGCPNGGDFSVLPTTRQITSAPTVAGHTGYSDELLPQFRHASEAAAPGSYRVALDPGTDRQIDAALTATTRTGLANFAFPEGKAQTVLVNATSSRSGATAGAVQIDQQAHEISGWVATGGFCYMPNHYKIYFSARFDRPFDSTATWSRQQLHTDGTSDHDESAANPLGLLDGKSAANPLGLQDGGPLANVPTAANTFAGIGVDGGTPTAQTDGKMPTAQTGALVTFAPSGGRAVKMRIGMSFVSVDGARRNLAAEAPATRTFAAVRSGARRAWNRALQRITVKGGEAADRRTFYSMLYHALISPTTVSDTDGRYLGFDDKVHDAGMRVHYADFSGWDVYRSQMPLLGLIAPRRASDVAASLVADAQQSGWLPKWSVANAHTEVMTGDPADPAIAGIYAMGARDFDLRAALRAMVKGATQSSESGTTGGPGGYVERAALDAYQRLGYVPDEQASNLIVYGLDFWRRALSAPAASPALAWGSAGTTLEYATADFAVARMAAAAGDAATCQTFVKRSGRWRNVFDSATGSVRPRSVTGEWVGDFDPDYNDSLSSKGFPEGNAAQYTWMIPHDPAGLVAALGGRDKALARLDRFFTKLNGGLASPYAFMGNEPNSNAPWLYNWLGAPYKAQDVVRRTMLELFDSAPGGYPGNDDLGQMSAWYVLSAVGLYPAIPGSDVLAIGSPLFASTRVRLSGGTLRIIGRGAARNAPYVHGLNVNGRAWKRPWVRATDLLHGARMRFKLRRTPSRTWAAKAAAAPPSYGAASHAACARSASPSVRPHSGPSEQARGTDGR